VSAIRRLLFLCAGVSSLGLAAPGPATHDLLRELNSSSSGWALGDFDGDRHIDLVTAGPGRPDGRGYAHNVRFELSASPQISFTLRSRSATVQITAKDIDGDQDRDLVFLEPGSSEPIAIWLNDGSGHFREGDLGDFRDAFGKRDSKAFESPVLSLKAFAIVGNRLAAAVLRISVIGSDNSSETLARGGPQAPASSSSSRSQPRAPPQRS
jgi:hypothetical protein